MDDFDRMLYEALVMYREVLAYKGYVKDSDVDKILLIMFISDFLYDYQDLITEEDYRNIDRIITCLYGTSCLITYGKCGALSTVLDSINSAKSLRQADTTDLRVSQFEQMRLVNY